MGREFRQRGRRLQKICLQIRSQSPVAWRFKSYRIKQQGEILAASPRNNSARGKQDGSCTNPAEGVSIDAQVTLNHRVCREQVTLNQTDYTFDSRL
jgi:hypothetical protein